MKKQVFKTLYICIFMLSINFAANARIPLTPANILKASVTKITVKPAKPVIPIKITKPTGSQHTTNHTNYNSTNKKSKHRDFDFKDDTLFYKNKIDSLKIWREPSNKHTNLKYLAKWKDITDRFMSYVRIESTSIDVQESDSFPLSDGQKKLAQLIYDEINSFKSKDQQYITVKLTDKYCIYVDIPANKAGDIPPILFMAHMDVTPEAPGKNIKPIIHIKYNGQDIKLENGVVISPDTPQGEHLKNLKGQTIITSDGTTILGADDKTGCTILVTAIKNIIKNPKLKHGRVMFLLSQNEDVGKAALGYDPEIFETKPEIVIDVDGNYPESFSVANFTATMQAFTFKGNPAHPSYGFENKYGDALTASAYFIGSLPPSVHPSASYGTKGYLHCYALTHPTDSTGQTTEEDYTAKIRLRYFDKAEGDTLRQYLNEAYKKTRQAYPFVEIIKSDEIFQYDNIAYTMPEYVPDLVINAAAKAGITMSPRSERGGTTSAMLTDKLPGGPCIYSGQQNPHSVYEWCCIQEMIKMTDVVLNIIKQTAEMK